MGPPDTSAAAVAAILGAAYLVRQYRRPGQRLQRAQALQRLGLEVRAALERGGDPEAVLYALADGLYPFEAGRHDGRR